MADVPSRRRALHATTCCTCHSKSRSAIFLSQTPALDEQIQSGRRRHSAFYPAWSDVIVHRMWPNATKVCCRGWVSTRGCTVPHSVRRASRHPRVFAFRGLALRSMCGCPGCAACVAGIAGSVVFRLEGALNANERHTAALGTLSRQHSRSIGDPRRLVPTSLEQRHRERN